MGTKPADACERRPASRVVPHVTLGRVGATVAAARPADRGGRCERLTRNLACGRGTVVGRGTPGLQPGRPGSASAASTSAATRAGHLPAEEVQHVYTPH